MSLVNDSFLTTVCLQYRPYDVAAAVVYLAHLLVSLPRVDVASLNTNESVVMGELGPYAEYRTQISLSCNGDLVNGDGDGDGDDDDGGNLFEKIFFIRPWSILPSRCLRGHEMHFLSSECSSNSK